MAKAKTTLKLVAFDAARYLDDDEAIAEYMTAVLETNDPDLLLLALSDVARAKGMAQVAKVAGLEAGISLMQHAVPQPAPRERAAAPPEFPSHSASFPGASRTR